MRRPTLVGLVLGLTAVALVGPATAGATVTVGLGTKSTTLNVTDTSGATDDIRLTVDRSSSPVRYLIESTQPIARAGTFCTAPTTSGGRSRTHCPISTPTSILATLAGGNDKWNTIFVRRTGELDKITVNGGSGNDSISGNQSLSGSGADRDTLNGNDGDDTIHGEKGFDTLTGGAGDDLLNDDDSGPLSGPDILEGGSGEDDLFIHEGFDKARGNEGDDTISEVGRPGESDDVDGGADIDELVLEREPDTVIQELEAVAFISFRGSSEESPKGIETFVGTHGSDLINGALSQRSTLRTYEGRGGADRLVGSDLTDKLIGGEGADRLFGRDGNDVLNAKQGELVADPDDVIDCGPGDIDSATIDLIDPNAEGCETVNRSAIGEGPHVRIGSVRLRGRTAAVRLKCPRKLGHKCKGKLRIAARKRRLRRSKGKRYAIKAGRKRTVRVRLRARDARRLEKRAFVESREKGDVAGTKSTLVRKRL